MERSARRTSPEIFPSWTWAGTVPAANSSTKHKRSPKDIRCKTDWERLMDDTYTVEANIILGVAASFLRRTKRAPDRLGGPRMAGERALEQELQSKLKQPWTDLPGGLAKIAGGDSVCEVGPRRAARQLEVGMVEDVEYLEAELEGVTLPRFYVLEQGLVRIPVAGTLKGVPAEVPVAAQTRSREETTGTGRPELARGRRRARLKPAVHPLGAAGIEISQHRIGAVIACAVFVEVTLAASSTVWGEVRASLERPEALILPAAQHVAHETRLVLLPRKLIDIVEGQPVPYVEGRIAPV